MSSNTSRQPAGGGQKGEEYIGNARLYGSRRSGTNARPRTWGGLFERDAGAMTRWALRIEVVDDGPPSYR
jgi:hypothetical protein